MKANIKYIIIGLLLVASSHLFAQNLIFNNVSLVDGLSSTAQPNMSLKVQDGKIVSIQSGKMDDEEGFTLIDLRGKYMMPGMIDAHVHLRNFSAAKTALYSGVTTVRSMGVSHFMDVGMRELAKEGAIESPEVLAAGYHVRPTMADGFYMDRPDLAYLKKDGIHGIKIISLTGQAMIDRKVDWIKTNATARAGLPNTDPREPYFDVDEMKALVETGQKAGVPVAAHAHGDEGGFAAVSAGVKSIEHGTYLSPKTLDLMKEKGTYLVPTIAIVSDLKEPGGDYDIPLLAVRGRHMLPRIRETAKMAYEKGVKIIAATDTGYDPNSVMRLGLELEEFVALGMSPFEAIQAATSKAAKFLEVDDHTGSIQKGLEADLLIMENNPLENIGAIHDPLMVVNNGKIVVDRIFTK